ncbi:LysR family transcriptional regulator [Streptomyces sp. enrichment culture]|uniref:LysR family transcriptional regulator n=1 Tax=Streptomyces sp. enrichment culture TaxID=1795815 RepID=UPI003F56BC88
MDSKHSGDRAVRLPDLPGHSVGGGDPSVHQLRLFLTVAQELHFGRAAARLFMTQPALSRQIRVLEAKLGVQLLDRTSRSVALTPMGRELVSEAREVVHAMAQLRRRATAYSRELRGHLVVGFIAGDAAMPTTHAILDELRARHPRITVTLRSLPFDEQFDALADGDVQAAFLRPPLPLGVRSMPLSTEPRVACLSAADPLAALAADRPVTLTDLTDHLVVDVPVSSSRTWWDNWAINPRPDGTPVRFGPVASDIEALLNTVARGTAMSFLPAAARNFYARPGLAYIDVIDAPGTASVLVWMRDDRERPAVEGLLQAGRAVLARSEDPPFPSRS